MKFSFASAIVMASAALAFSAAPVVTLAQTAAAELAPLWQIQARASSLTFNTTKAGAAGVGGIVETMQFTRYSGGLEANGRMQLKIDLSSIDTGISIRDERLQTLFWNVANAPSVTFSGQLKADDQKKLLKEPVALEVEGSMTMAGVTKPVKAQLQVTPVNGKLWVSTRRPILVKTEDFGLTPGVEALRAIMGLNFLAGTVPVNFQLELSKAAPEKVAATTAMPPSAW
jgi:polyisoprenoid-binding protein YceI